MVVVISMLGSGSGGGSSSSGDKYVGISAGTINSTTEGPHNK